MCKKETPCLIIYLLLVIASCALTACKELISQNPADTFASKEFPKHLEVMRSQLREIPVREQQHIVNRTADDLKRQDLLRVAVIDGGFDLANPDLIGQYEYQVEDNHIIGAGVDIMGNGKFASHIYVDPTLFAFGSKKVQDGKIFEPLASPLAQLKEMDKFVMHLILQGIQDDPDLRESYFSRFNSSANFLMLDSINENLARLFSSYEENKAGQRLLSPKNYDEFPDRRLKYIVDTGWDFRSNKRIVKHPHPSYMQIEYSFQSLEHADKFFKLVAAAFAALEEKYSYQESVKNVLQFMNDLRSQESDPIQRVDAIHILNKALKFTSDYARNIDPITIAEDAFRHIPQYKDKSLSEALITYAKDLRERAQKQLKHLKIYDPKRKEIIAGLTQVRNLELVGQMLEALQKDPDAYKKLRSDIRRLAIRTQHPYLEESSNTNSHGTHVAGIVAKQSPRIRIVPVRVTTQSTGIAKVRMQEIETDATHGFLNWTKLPMIAELQKVIAIEEYNDSNLSRAITRKEIEEYLQLKQSANLIFITDVLKAVEAAGQNKIKLANVSLGTNFKKDISLKKTRESLIQDMFSEYVRYKIGQVIQEKAPGTLFLIASGNDRGWIDGVTHSSFPVGITSSRLLKIAEKMGLPHSPNNAVRNVLAISSVNPRGVLTPFSNIFIDPRIYQIFSTGEEIMSAVPPKSESHAGALVRGRFSKIDKMVAALTRFEEGDRIERIRIAGNENSPEAIEEELNVLRTLELHQDLAVATSKLIHLTYPIHRVRKSGTSMAAPTASGSAAVYLLKRMDLEGVTSDALYDHPDFTPERIIQDLLAIAKNSPQSNEIITIKMLADEIKHWSESPAEIRARQFMNQKFPTPQQTKLAGCVIKLVR